MRDPRTPEDWLWAARERMADAEAMLPTRSQSIGPVYMAGYAIECALKAYIHKRQGAAAWGHELKSLWQQSGFHLSDLGDQHGTRTYFFQYWGPNLRYQTELNSVSLTTEELLEGARWIMQWLHRQMGRIHRRGR
jgi:hypothetical protein